MDSLLIPRNITALLQSLRDCVNGGYTFWTSGTIGIHKAEKLCAKFHDRYGVLATRNQRHYNRLNNQASAYLYMYPQIGGDVLDWILIATKGKGAIHEHEKLADNDSGRRIEKLRWKHYEIINLNNRMTWRLRSDVAEEWEKKMINSARKVDIEHLQQTTEILCNFPMFTGVRQQAWKIIQKAQKTRIRHHYSLLLTIPKLPVLRRITVYSTPPKTLGILVDEYKERIKSSIYQYDNYQINNRDSNYAACIQ